MIDSLAFQPALGWYQVPFWLGDVCPRGRLRPRKYHGTKQFVLFFFQLRGPSPLPWFVLPVGQVEVERLLLVVDASRMGGKGYSYGVFATPQTSS